MRKIATESSQRTTLRLVLGGVGERASAYSPFGPVRAGLITLQTTEQAPLSELLSCLERKIENLQSKSYEVSSISKVDIQEVLVKHLSIVTELDGIK